MSAANDKTEQLRDRIVDAYRAKTPLVISAGNSKSFYGRQVEGEKLQLDRHQGILSYQASELVITARSGTCLQELEAALDQHNQQLAFEPPRHTEHATLGGAIACGLSGPARAFRGAARDFVLGAKIINGKGELLQFGGQVMKNVAGYDVSRLMVGAQGTLGVLTEISLKVLPKSEAETTLAFEVDAAQGHQWLRDWLHQGQPISASCHYRGILSVRLSSTANSIRQAHKRMGGEIASNELWRQLRHQNHPCFRQDNLWRLSLPPSTNIHNEDDQLIEWGGALRWKVSNNDLFEQAQRLHGHATRYALRAASPRSIFQPLQPAILAIHKRIKQAFDPYNILNPCRVYQEL
jgi:glycolate oxidase FAD binding subunit